MEKDNIDKLATSTLDGYLVRKDLAHTFRSQFPVPTYVVEFLLGRFCATSDENEIKEGLECVRQQLEHKTVKAGEAELAKSKARENGSVNIIDIITARLDARTDSYLATLPSLQLTDVRISPDLINLHERMLTGGFYADISLTYDSDIAQEARGRPFGVESLREIQLSKRDVLDKLAEARKSFTSSEWKKFLLRSVGIEPLDLSDRQINAFLLRMTPFVERNYNLVELGPRGTGKSHLYQQISPYAHLISGGKATVAKMFVNNATGRRGLVCLYDVVCFDEVSGISFDQKDGVNIMKGYMESAEFSRGNESIRADGSIVMLGNFEVDVERQQRTGHLFKPLPPEMQNDAAFMDRIHAYLPGWDVPKINKELLTDHFGMVSDFLSECWTLLRNQSRVNYLQGRVTFGGALSGRDTNAVNKTTSALLKLLYPGPVNIIPDEDLEWAVRIAMEARRRVKEQQKRVVTAEFRDTHFSYQIEDEGIEKFVTTPELYNEKTISREALEPGQVWTISPGMGEDNPGLYQIAVNAGTGSGCKILNKPTPPAFKESVSCAIENLYAKPGKLVGNKNPRQHEFTVQFRPYDVSKSGAKIGVSALIALCTALLGKNVHGGLIIVGELNLAGSIDSIHNAVTIAEIAIEKGASTLLMPVDCRKQLLDLSNEMAAKIDIQFYLSPEEALTKAIIE
ncbi:MAG: BREX system Lon protease-like protein BrxL [Deltaproteobacteria bacterium]|jgi:ATP-dependent Lon protease|nr:BREX system Lon protease-like protein BrxL [Deltaproteobacteria bacterium]